MRNFVVDAVASVCHFPASANNGHQQQTTETENMKMTLTTYQIADALMADDYATWSHPGALALAEYFGQLEEDMGDELELDVVAIRCDYSEHESLKHWASVYWGGDEQAADALGLTIAMGGEDVEETDEEIDDLIRDYISDHGQLIEFDGGVIVSSF